MQRYGDTPKPLHYLRAVVYYRALLVNILNTPNVSLPNLIALTITNDGNLAIPANSDFVLIKIPYNNPDGLSEFKVNPGESLPLPNVITNDLLVVYDSMQIRANKDGQTVRLFGLSTEEDL